jgi:hypothetical protein
MAPPGTRIKAHETPSRRRTWAPHGQAGWYIGLGLEHYRCYVYTSGKAGAQIPHLPLEDDSPPWGRYSSMYVTLHGLHGCV